MYFAPNCERIIGYAKGPSQLDSEIEERHKKRRKNRDKKLLTGLIALVIGTCTITNERVINSLFGYKGVPQAKVYIPIWNLSRTSDGFLGEIKFDDKTYYKTVNFKDRTYDKNRAF